MKKRILILSMSLGCLACSKVQFGTQSSSSSPTEQSTVQDASLAFPFKPTTETFAQDDFTKNITTLNFQVTDASGNSVGGLQSSDFNFFENGQKITKFQFGTKSQQIDQQADIVIVLDITGSMVPTIESAKTNIAKFVQQLQDQKIHASVCLFTFGDHVVTRCTKFSENDPANPVANPYADLLDQLSRTHAIAGANDPGGTDLPENQLRALMDASQTTPWHTGAQRMAVLVTDAQFHYAPGFEGNAGADAPTYDDAVNTIVKNQMTLFAVAPNWPGYILPFQGKTSLVSATHGMFFDYWDYVKGIISLDQVFTALIGRINTTYSITYTVDDNPGLDPTLPLDKRVPTVQLATLAGDNVIIQSFTSNQPSGHGQVHYRWTLSNYAIRAASLSVQVNGVNVGTGFDLEGDDLVFQTPPDPDAKITVTFEHAALRDNVNIQTLTLGGMCNISTLVVTINGKTTPASDITVTQDREGHYLIVPADDVFADSDPYGIRASGALIIRAHADLKNIDAHVAP